MLGGININKNIDLEKDENYYQMLQYTQNYMKDQGIEISISELESLIDENGFEEQSDIENSVIKDFKWNCETYFCVEQFLEEATEQEKQDFIKYIKKGNIGLSATYLNFNDLVDVDVLNKRTKEFCNF